MKRNDNKVPEFDEIIFENRNKTYGAYDLRKRYKSATSLSLLGAVTISIVSVIALSTNPGEVIASTGQEGVIITVSDPIDPPKYDQPEIKPLPAVVEVPKYVAPEVVTDTSLITSEIPTTDFMTQTTHDGNVKDTLTFVETTDLIIPPETKPEIPVRLEEMPEYPGGISALMKYISENIVYPTEAQNLNIQGRVSLKFVVNTDGSVDRIEVIGSVDPLLDAEAVRVVKTLPKFKPGRQGGVPAPVWFSLPVLFRIDNN
jgi:periplasmic protein TonB